MDVQKMIRKENQNAYKIYLYADLEEDLYNAYEFSAYLLTRLFKSLKLQKDIKSEIGTVLYVTQFSAESVVEHFSDSGLTVGNDFVRIVLDDSERCAKWRREFDKMKKNEKGITG